MAVSPDGQRFLLLATAPENADGEAAPSQLTTISASRTSMKSAWERPSSSLAFNR